jgi:hypothetical protein
VFDRWSRDMGRGYASSCNLVSLDPSINEEGNAERGHFSLRPAIAPPVTHRQASLTGFVSAADWH